MVTIRTSSNLRRQGSDSLNDVWGGMGFVLFGAGLIVYWLFHPHTWKTVAGGVLLIVLGLYFLRRAWRIFRLLHDRLNAG